MSRRKLSKSDKDFFRQFSVFIVLLGSFAACLLVIASVVYHLQPNEQADVATITTHQRLSPVAAVYAGNTGKAALAAAAAAKPAPAAAYGGTTDGKTIFDHLCTTCHTNAATGAPQLGDKAEWAPRIAEGIPTLIQHAMDGYKGPHGNGAVMPPKGGNPALTKKQITATVKWIVSQSK